MNLTKRLQGFSLKNLRLMSIFALTSGIILFSCSNPALNDDHVNSSKKKSLVKPPFEGIEIQGDLFNINASQANEIRTQKGSTIVIPANTLVDGNGKKVSGKVQLSFKSINTPGEIIASGIPMTYDSAGVKHDFISAGMFEIAATQKGKELFIAEGKSIDVDFASFKSGNDFSFYKLNEETGAWSYKGISLPRENKVKSMKLKRFKDDNIIELDIDYSVHDELKEFDQLKWVCIDGNDKNNPCKNKWILKERWYDIALTAVDEKSGIYEMTLSNTKKTISFQVSPYQMEGDLAEMSSKISQLNETVKAKKMEEERIQLEADINRNFKISSFGTYNWDKIEKQVAEGILAFTNASFKVDSKELEKPMSVFHFSGKDKLLSRITKTWEKLVYNPNEVNKILVVLPGNYVALSNAEEFKQIGQQGNFVFKLKKRSQKIKSIAELDALLAKG